MAKKLLDFRIASKEEIDRARKISNGYIQKAIFPLSPGSVHRTIIYKIMDETFGAPNYIPGEKSTWEWVVYTEAGLLTVYDIKGDWSIATFYSKYSEELLVNATKLKEALFEEAKKVKPSKSQIKKNKVGGTIKNPYSFSRVMVDHLMLQAKKLEEESNKLQAERNFMKFAGSMKKTIEIINLNNVIASFYKAAFMTTFLSLEGFLNLIFKLFIRERYRDDIFERKLKREILPIKILEIDIYCHSFKYSPFERGDELFSAIQHFIDIRNKFLHSNICEQTESHLVKIGKYIVTTEEELKVKFGLPSDFDKINKIHVIRAKKLVEKFVLKILQSMGKKVKVPFTMVHSYQWISYFWDKKDSIIFPLDKEDFVPLDEVETFLSKSTELDKEYYHIN